MYKVIYPDYISHHYVQELYELVVSTFFTRWALHIRSSQFLLSVRTPQGKISLHQMRTSLYDVLQETFPRWQSHQVHPYAYSADSTEVPHGNSDNTAFVFHLKCEPLAPTVNHDEVTSTTTAN